MNNPTTKLSVFYKGRWTFAIPNNVVLETETQIIYRVDFKFGLIKEQEESPTKFSKVGNAGDFISMDNNGVLSYLSQSEFLQLYPKKILNKKETGTMSSNLNDPKYLTKVLQESPTSSYNRPIPKNL